MAPPPRLPIKKSPVPHQIRRFSVWDDVPRKLSSTRSTGAVSRQKAMDFYEPWMDPPIWKKSEMRPNSVATVTKPSDSLPRNNPVVAEEQARNQHEQDAQKELHIRQAEADNTAESELDSKRQP